MTGVQTCALPISTEEEESESVEPVESLSEKIEADEVPTTEEETVSDRKSVV